MVPEPPWNYSPLILSFDLYIQVRYFLKNSITANYLGRYLSLQKKKITTLGLTEVKVPTGYYIGTVVGTYLTYGSIENRLQEMSHVSKQNLMKFFKLRPRKINKIMFI